MKVVFGILEGNKVPVAGISMLGWTSWVTRNDKCSCGNLSMAPTIENQGISSWDGLCICMGEDKQIWCKILNDYMIKELGKGKIDEDFRYLSKKEGFFKRTDMFNSVA